MRYRPSIRSVAIAVAVLVAAVVALAMTALWQVTRHDHINEAAEQMEAAARSYARAIAQQVRSHRRLLEHLAADRIVQEFLLFGDRAGAERWAHAARPFFADNVGLTLVARDGDVLGNPAELRIGPGCRTDLQALARGEALPGPRVHREIPGLEHFDLTVPVHDNEGRVLGLLFASFSLRVLEDALVAPENSHSVLRLYDADNSLLASSGANLARRDAVTTSAAVPDTVWRLELVQPLSLLSASRDWFWLGTLLVAAVAMILIAAGGMLAGRWLRRDLLVLNNMLDDVATHRPIRTETLAHIAETAAVLPKVSALAHLLVEQRERLESLSRTDELTGLANRRHFNEQCEQAVRLAVRGISVTLALIDVDGLKRLNDTSGHAAGDRVLQVCSAALRSRVRDSDLVARIGGDEFAILFFGLSSDEAHDLIGRLRATFRELQATDGQLAGALRCTLSVGLSSVDPAIDHDVPTLLERVDRALYAAKAQGRDAVVLA